MEKRKRDKEIRLYIIIIAITAFGLGLSNSVMSNYFKDAYQVDAFKRGLIEFPREIPGILSVFVIAMIISCLWHIDYRSNVYANGTYSDTLFKINFKR